MITRNSLSKVITSIDQLSVATDYFLLTTEVAVAQSRVQVYSVLWRQASGKTSVLMHSIGAY
jgi:type II secretory pathway component PulK